MTTPRHIAVIDIGKTNAKLALVDLVTLSEIAVVTTPNTVLPGPPWPHYDVDAHWEFLLAALKKFHRDHRIDAISVTTHGASAALIAQDGSLAAPVLDYEFEGPDRVAQAYDAIRPAFAETGSPRLLGGLNVGAQLHWQFGADPSLRNRTAQIVTYPQYWGHRLTGVAATDVTSIGCHTDLWLPHLGAFSDLAAKLGVEGKIAPVRKSTDVLGPILPQIAEATGLRPDTPVCVGIHDSNASLYPHILTQEGPFSVVSTGTWVVVMTMGGDGRELDPERDTLVNTNARGQAVPSARFMGGREYEVVRDGHTGAPSAEDVAEVLAASLMILPAVEAGAGPFQGWESRWSGPEPAVGTGARAVALSFYLAMMTETCLALTGAQGPAIVEGPFAQDPLFSKMLAVATGRPVLQSGATTGTSIGAALLFGGRKALAHPSAVGLDRDMLGWAEYAARWRDLVNAT
jgi:sugar (pentulose or hexulose) kinase